MTKLVISSLDVFIKKNLFPNTEEVSVIEEEDMEEEIMVLQNQCNTVQKQLAGIYFSLEYYHNCLTILYFCTQIAEHIFVTRFGARCCKPR